MMRISRERPALSVAFLLLSMLAISQILAPVSLSLPKIQEYELKSEMAKADPAQLSPSPLRDSYAVIDQRPLFIRGRRPINIVTAAAPIMLQMKSLDTYTIIGIVDAPDRAIAVLKGPSGVAIHLRKGQELDGWRLETIGRNKLVFTAGEQHQELTFKVSKIQQGPAGLRTNPGISTNNTGTPQNNPAGMPPR